jgi:hypothetical protein
MCRRVGHDGGAEHRALALRLEHQLGAVCDRIVDHLRHAVGSGAAHHRPHVGCGIFGIADLELLGGGDEQIEEALEHRSFHDDALRRDALLAARLEGRSRDARCRIGKIGIRTDDVRCIGAELADKFLRAGRACKLVAGSGAAGDRDRGNQRMAREQLCCIPPAWHDVEQAVGNARLLRSFSKQQRHLGAGRRGLDHDCVAHRDRGGDLLNEQIGGSVEGRHRGDHAVRNARREAEATGAGCGHIERQHFAEEMRELRGASADECTDPLRLECGGAPRLADEANERAHQLAFDLVDGVGRGKQPFHPLGNGRVAMLEECRMRVLDRGIDDLGIGLNDLRRDALVDRAHKRGEFGLEPGGTPYPRHQLRYGH